MKMVIRGAQAPKCDKKPLNPTSASHVGTMSGQAGCNRIGKGAIGDDVHKHQYQGLLQAPRLPGKLDHQHGRTSPEGPDAVGDGAQEGLVSGSARMRGPDGQAEQPFVIGQTGTDSIKHDQTVGAGHGLGLLAKDVGKPPKTSQPQQHRAKTGQRYHYQKFGGQSAASFGALGGQRSGVVPGQKSIKQQRDLAQLRFYQTLTNQPHLISQSHSQGKQVQQMQPPSQVKMLSSMRLAQQPSRSLNWQQQQAQDAQDFPHESQQPVGNPAELAAEGRRSFVDNQMAQQRFDALGSGQPTLRPSQVSHLETTGLGRGQVQDHLLRHQMRSKTPQRAATGAGIAQGGAREPLAQVEVVGGAVGRGTAARSNDLHAAKSRGPGRGGSQAERTAEGRQLPPEDSGKDAQPSPLDKDRIEALRQENVTGTGTEEQVDQSASRNLAGRKAISAAGQPGLDTSPQAQQELAEASNPSHLRAAEYGVSDDPYEQKRSPQVQPSRTNDARSRLTGQGSRNLHLLSHILNGPVPPTVGQVPPRDVPFQKSNATIRQHESVRNSESGVGGMRVNNAIKDAAARRSHSPRARNQVVPSSISRERDGKGSNPRRGKNGPIHIAKIEKKNFNLANDKVRGAYNMIGGPEEDFNRRMERFSSQGQEELVQAYQLPTVYAGNESKAGFQSQHQSKKRNQTSYGGPRAKAAVGVAGRNYEYLRESINSIPRIAGGGAYSSASGNQLVPVDRQLSILPQPSQPSHIYKQAVSKGALSNILVKTCSFQAREAAAQKRDQIRTAYTITRAGRQGMGILPQIEAKVSSLQDVNRDPDAHGVALTGVQGAEHAPGSIDGAAGRGAGASINMIEGATGQQRVDNIVLGKNHQDADGQMIQEYYGSKKIGRSSVASRVSAPGPCKRFMERGNKPVPTNYEEQDVVADLKKVGESAVVPYQQPEDGLQRGSNVATEMTNMSGKAASRQSGRQMVYGNLKLGHFDEEINGINLSKLFSVYGPQSAEGNRRKKVRQSYHSSGMQQMKNKDISKSSPQRGFDSYQPKSSQQHHNVHALPLQGERQSRTGANNRLGNDVNTSSMMGVAGAANAPAAPAGRSGDLAINDQKISQAGDKSKMEGRDHASTELDRQQLDDQQRLTTEHQDDFDISDEDESDEEEEEPLIIQLMESMFTRKKTVQESEQMISEISVDAIRQEIRRLALLEKCRLTTLQRQKFFEQRMQECEKLNELIKRENQDLSESILERPDLSTRENPFYLALKAQKEERDRYKQLLQLAIMNGVNGDKDMERPTQLTDGTRSQEIEASTKEDGANDIFKHTFVDILDDDKVKPATEEHAVIDAQQKADKKPKDIFYFYNLSFDLPTEYYKQLGDFSVVNRTQANKIKEFMVSFWPMLKGKKVQYKIAFDQMKEVFNVVLLGKDCPLSKCCKMTVYFQFTKDIGGKVICMENLCALNPLDHFNIELDVVKTLFYDYPLGQQPPMDSPENPGSPDANADVVKQLVQNETMTKAQYKRMKPTFKKIISQEISKMISKGTHMSLSIRDVIQNQNLEEKVHHQMNKGRITNNKPYVPKRLTQSKLLKLLYDTSSQASSQLSQFGMNDQQAFDGESGHQPMGSIQLTANEDLGFGVDNPTQYGSIHNQILLAQMPHELATSPHGLHQMGDIKNVHRQQFEANENVPYTQISMDDLFLAARAAERGEQPAILFSHTVQDKIGEEEAQSQNLVVLGQNQVAMEQQNFGQVQEHEAMIQADARNAVAGSLGTFNPGPSIVVKPKLAEQPGQEAQLPSSEQVQADGNLSGTQHQELNDNENALPEATEAGAAVSGDAVPKESTQAN